MILNKQIKMNLGQLFQNHKIKVPRVQSNDVFDGLLHVLAFGPYLHISFLVVAFRN